MADVVKGITWEALEHHHGTKGSDWLWALGVIVIAVAGSSLLLGNMLFAVLVIVGGSVMAILAVREPKTVAYAVTQRGLRVDDKLFPYSTLESFYLDEDDPLGPQLLAKSEKMFMPLIVMPVPEEYLDEIEDMVAARLPEEHIEEPFANKMLEFFGF